MKPYTFISYSRQCIGFVDDLALELEKQGFKTWLDYRILIPGRPWLEQINKGLAESDILLLVVSPESISSRSVEIEWRHYLEHKKRIILLIFQAVDLPLELERFEWVDFRGGFRSAVRRLIQCIENPSVPAHPAPQSGFKAPAMIWLTAVLSVIISIYSLFAIWTFIIPWVLAPLPARIFKRNFDLGRVQTALWTLPIALFFSLFLADEFKFVNLEADFDSNASLLYNLGLVFLKLQIFILPFLSTLLLLFLRLPAMQRWGKPEATLTKFANVYDPDIRHPEPVKFFIDHAPEDGMIADEITSELKKYGHTAADGIDSAEEVLVLISRFKSDTEADPEKQVVYPIIVQRAKVSPKLSRMQWIDFRKGIRNLGAIAQLLPQPERMLAAIGVRPTSGNEGPMPNIILALVDFLIIMAMVSVGSFLSYILELIHANLGFVFEREPAGVIGLILLSILVLAGSGGLIYYMSGALTGRRGWFASMAGLLLGFAGLILLSLLQGSLLDWFEALFVRHGSSTGEAMFAGLPFVFLVLGGLIVGLAALVFRKDLRLWLPARH